MSKNNEYPVKFLEYLVRLSRDSVCSPLILVDEYVFSTYFSALLQGITEQAKLEHVLKQYLPKLDLSIDETEALNGLDKQEKLIRIVNDLRAQFGDSITSTYVQDFFKSSLVYRELISVYKKLEKQQEVFKNLISDLYQLLDVAAQAKTSLELNLDYLGKTIKLSKAEKSLIELNFFLTTDTRAMIFRDFLFTITNSTYLHEHFYKVMLELSIQDPSLTEASKPIALGIVDYDLKLKRLKSISDFWVYTLSTYFSTTDKFHERFVEDVKTSVRTFSGAIAKVSAQDEKILTEFLQKAHLLADEAEVSDDGENDEAIGLNVMLYGPASLDKVGYVQKLLSALNFKSKKVRTRDAKNCDIPSICYVAQQYVKELSSDGYEPIILIIEQAEHALTKSKTQPSWLVDMLDGSLDGTRSDDSLSSDDLLLIKNPVPSIWLVSSPSQVTPENVGRFLFHVQAKGGSRADRREEVLKVVEEIGMPPELAVKLSKYQKLNVEQIKSAARTVIMLNRASDESNFLHLIANSQRALDREKMEELRDSVTKYSLEYLNLSGGLPINKIIASLKKKPHGTLCFYGAPGTGKTQLAEYLATELDKPLLIKPASELLSMWLGESEKNIAKMFDEAKAEDAILLLDEADSFMRDRSLASKSWEVTQVNELLQRMERFQGIFICATNLFSQIDAAALRRFTFKLEFKALTNDQRLKMLINESGVDVLSLAKPERKAIIEELELIKHLTPGDFATVRRQANLLDEQLSVEIWLARLLLESKTKMVGLERNGMGFLGGEVSSKSRS